MTTPRFRFTRNHEHARNTYEEYIKDRAVDIQSCLEARRTVRLEGETQVLITVSACGNCSECVRRGIMPVRTVVMRDWVIRVNSWTIKVTRKWLYSMWTIKIRTCNFQISEPWTKWQILASQVTSLKLWDKLSAFCLEPMNSLMLPKYESCVSVNNVPATSARDTVSCQERC